MDLLNMTMNRGPPMGIEIHDAKVIKKQMIGQRPTFKQSAVELIQSCNWWWLFSLTAVMTANLLWRCATLAVLYPHKGSTCFLLPLCCGIICVLDVHQKARPKPWTSQHGEVHAGADSYLIALSKWVNNSHRNHAYILSHGDHVYILSHGDHVYILSHRDPLACFFCQPR